MHVQKLFGLALFGALALGCGNNTSTSKDMATAADMAVTLVDMATTPPDMATTPPDLMLPLYNSCTAALFSDQSGNTGNRTVTFTNFTYTPACITIAVGQTVTFSGTFTSHPLRPGVGANATAGSPNNPIVATATGATKAITFPTAGFYPYNCQTHDGMNMNGVVQVK